MRPSPPGGVGGGGRKLLVGTHSASSSVKDVKRIFVRPPSVSSTTASYRDPRNDSSTGITSTTAPTPRSTSLSLGASLVCGEEGGESAAPTATSGAVSTRSSTLASLLPTSGP